jgi:hypothetical protein
MGGALLPIRANIHYFAENVARNRAELRALVDAGVRTFYVGHGGPMPVSSVRARLLRREVRGKACIPSRAPHEERPDHLRSGLYIQGQKTAHVIMARGSNRINGFARSRKPATGSAAPLLLRSLENLSDALARAEPARDVNVVRRLAVKQAQKAQCEHRAQIAVQRLDAFDPQIGITYCHRPIHHSSCYFDSCCDMSILAWRSFAVKLNLLKEWRQSRA